MSLSTCFVDPYSSTTILLVGLTAALKFWPKSLKIEFARSSALLFLIMSGLSSVIFAFFKSDMVLMTHYMLLGAFAASVSLPAVSLGEVKDMSEKGIKARARIIYKMPILGAILMYSLVNLNKVELVPTAIVLLTAVGVLFLGSTKISTNYRRCYLGSIFIILIAAIVRYYGSHIGEIGIYVVNVLFAISMIALAVNNELMTTSNNQES